MDIVAHRIVGNASSLPPRLPFLSPVLRMLRDSDAGRPVSYTMVCLSYRGYWTSKGRPSEKGITKDAIATLNWIKEKDYALSPSSPTSEGPSLVLWGQSIGAGFATQLAAQTHLFPPNPGLNLRLLILETPFLSIKSMLQTLYPQAWLPYRYLYPFLWNHLDNYSALCRLSPSFPSLSSSHLPPQSTAPLSSPSSSPTQQNPSPKILLLIAQKDELVPSSHGETLEKRCRELGIEVERKVVGGALHTDVMGREEGRRSVVDAIREIANE